MVCQLGVEGLLFSKRDQGFSLDGAVNAGVFGNKMDNEGSEESAWNLPWSNGGYNDSMSCNSTKASFLSELGLNLNYAFTKKYRPDSLI